MKSIRELRKLMMNNFFGKLESNGQIMVGNISLYNHKAFT